MSRVKLLGSVVVALATRPRLWVTALSQMRRFAPDGWWRRPPFLPIPDPELVRFRASTQYGDPDRLPTSDDVITWLGWCRSEARRGAE
jgi:hypothetical protein